MPPKRSNSSKRKKKSQTSGKEEKKEEVEKEVEDAAAILVGMSNVKLDDHQSSKLKEQIQETMKRTQIETTALPASQKITKNVDMEGEGECSEELPLIQWIRKKKRGSNIRDVSNPVLTFDEADSVNFNTAR